MQDAADPTAAVSEVTQGRATDEEAALSAAAAERLHASPELTFDFESLLQDNMRILGLEVLEGTQVRSSEAVDGLGIIPHHRHFALGCL